MDQRSIVLCLHLKRLLAHAIHDNLVATLDLKVVAYGTVTRHLREAKAGIAKVILDPESSSPYLDHSDRAILEALEEKTSRFRPCENLPEPPISHKVSSIEGWPNRSGSYDLFFTGCRTFCQTLRR
jgi:hypothetical protein